MVDLNTYITYHYVQNGQNAWPSIGNCVEIRRHETCYALFISFSTAGRFALHCNINSARYFNSSFVITSSMILSSFKFTLNWICTYISVHVMQSLSIQSAYRAECRMQRLYLYEFNSSPPSAAYMRQWTGSILVQIMACRLVGAKPLSEPILKYC